MYQVMFLRSREGGREGEKEREREGGREGGREREEGREGRKRVRSGEEGMGKEGRERNGGMAVVLLLHSRFIMTEGHWILCHIKVEPANASSLGLKAKQLTY